MNIPWTFHAWGLPLALDSCHAYIRHTGNRTDLAQLTDIIRNGGSLRAAAEANPSCYARHARGLQELRSILSRPRSPQEPPRVLWFYGPTGSGKSKLAYNMVHNPDDPHSVNGFYKNPSTKWWCGFDGTQPVVIDDYRCNMCTFSELLRLLDRYPMQVETKGGSVAFNSPLIILTAPQSPMDMWSGRTQEDLQQLLRRITEVRFFEVGGPPEGTLTEHYFPANE